MSRAVGILCHHIIIVVLYFFANWVQKYSILLRRMSIVAWVVQAAFTDWEREKYSTMKWLSYTKQIALCFVLFSVHCTHLLWIQNKLLCTLAVHSSVYTRTAYIYREPPPTKQNLIQSQTCKLHLCSNSNQIWNLSFQVQCVFLRIKTNIFKVLLFVCHLYTFSPLESQWILEGNN